MDTATEGIKIISDNKWRYFLYGNEVPQKVRDEYSYLCDEDSYDQWLKYRGQYYHISDFMAFDSDNGMGEDWDGYYNGTVWCGVLIKVHEEGEQYKIGRYLS